VYRVTSVIKSALLTAETQKKRRDFLLFLGKNRRFTAEKAFSALCILRISACANRRYACGEWAFTVESSVDNIFSIENCWVWAHSLVYFEQSSKSWPDETWAECQFAYL